MPICLTGNNGSVNLKSICFLVYVRYSQILVEYAIVNG